MNYIKIMNWFWQEVPYRPGYKSEYGIVFLAVVDLCNRNDWRETSAEYDRMINRVRVSKRLYYEAIKWLSEEGMIGYQRGYNDYSPAKFSVKVEVQKGDTTAPLPHLSSTTTDTTGVPTAAPIIDKPLNKETDKQQSAEADAVAIEIDNIAFEITKRKINEVRDSVLLAKIFKEKECMTLKIPVAIFDRLVNGFFDEQIALASAKEEIKIDGLRHHLKNWLPIQVRLAADSKYHPQFNPQKPIESTYSNRGPKAPVAFTPSTVVFNELT